MEKSQEHTSPQKKNIPSPNPSPADGRGGFTPAASHSSSMKSERLLSLDAYRGMVMLLLAFAAVHAEWWEPIAHALADSPVWYALVMQFEHVEWAGIVLWDMIQPSFMFMVGVSMAYSYVSRQRQGHSYGKMLRHASYRAVVLVLLGVFLRSLGQSETQWRFDDVVSQIGFGYVALFLLWGRGWRMQLGSAVAILVGYWMLFAFWPLPASDYDYAAVHGVQNYEGFFAHWNKNANPVLYFDQWFLNLFPRAEPFVANSGGYHTLNFIPSLATMIFGLMAGEMLRSDESKKRKLILLLAAGTVGVLLGWLLEVAGICPNVKHIWTPSFGLISSGLCLLFLAALYGIIDLLKWQRWAWPAVIVGQNSIAMYCMTYLIATWIAKTLLTHLGTTPFTIFGETYKPLLINLAVGTCLWLICLWMYRRKIFLRI